MISSLGKADEKWIDDEDCGDTTEVEIDNVAAGIGDNDTI